MTTTIILEGMEKVQQDFEDFKFSGRKVVPRYLDLIANSAISLLKQNTPKDSGELANSWTVLERGINYVTIGVPDEQEGLLQALLFGTLPHDIVASEGKSLGPFIGRDGRPFWSKKVHVKGITGDNFVANIDAFINGLMSQTMANLLASSHRFYQPFANVANIQKITGLTGTQYIRRRMFGRSALFRPRTGNLGNRVRIGRRRRVGLVSNIKKVELG